MSNNLQTNVTRGLVAAAICAVIFIILFVAERFLQKRYRCLVYMYRVTLHHYHHEQVRQPQHCQLQQGDRQGDNEGAGQHGDVQRPMN